MVGWTSRCWWSKTLTAGDGKSMVSKSLILGYGHLCYGGLRHYTTGDGKTKVCQSVTLKYGRLGYGGLRHYTTGDGKTKVN